MEKSEIFFLFFFYFLGSYINQMAAPGHFKWKNTCPKLTWLEKNIFFCKDATPAADIVRWNSNLMDFTAINFWCATCWDSQFFSSKYQKSIIKVTYVDLGTFPGVSYAPSNARFLSSWWGRFNFFFKFELFKGFDI